MHEWRSGLDVPFEQPEAPTPLDRDIVVADNVRLQAEVTQLERELGQTVASLHRLSARLVDLERHALRTGGAEAELRRARAALAEAEGRAVEAEEGRRVAEAAVARLQADLEALGATRVMRYSAGARSVYGRLRRVVGPS